MDEISSVCLRTKVGQAPIVIERPNFQRKRAANAVMRSLSYSHSRASERLYFEVSGTAVLPSSIEGRKYICSTVSQKGFEKTIGTLLVKKCEHISGDKYRIMGIVEG